jgi:hypothetical protein
MSLLKRRGAAMANSAELSQSLPQRTEENNIRPIKIAGIAA